MYAEQKYAFTYRAIVIDNDDPKKLGRLVLQVPELFGVDLVTDWAKPKNGYLSAKNSSANNPQKPPDRQVRDPSRDGDKGDFFVPDIGDGVWVDFEAGDPCRPLWSGRWWAEPGGGSEVPMLAREKPDESQIPPKGTDFMVTAVPTVLDEPPISYDPTYPFNRVLKTKQGIIIEIDDTPGKERIHIWHPTRTWKEIHPDGTVTEHVQVRRYVYIEADDDKHVKGDWNVHIVGDATLHVEGDYIRHIEGNEIVKIDGSKFETIGVDFIQYVGNETSRAAGSHIEDLSPRIDHN
jgi:hypothetical protein